MSSPSRTSLWGKSLLSAALVAVLLPAAPAAADPRSEARNKLVQGGEFLKHGQFEEALARFQEAYRLVPSPKIQYNFGLAYRGLGRKADALEAFERFLAEAPEAPKETRQNAARERAQLANQITVLEVKVDLPGAEIFIDGRSYGTGRTTPIYLDPGPHQLAVEKSGEGTAYTERINATAGQKITVMARLMRSAGTEPPAQRDSTPPAQTVRPIDTGPPATDTPPPAADAGPRWQPVAAWTAAGGAAVALGFGILELLSSNSKFKQFNANMECGGTFPNHGGPLCNTLYEDASTARTLSIVGFGVAGALAGTSVVLFLLTPEKPKPQETALACGPTLGLPGVSCTGRF